MRAGRRGKFTSLERKCLDGAFLRKLKIKNKHSDKILLNEQDLKMNRTLWFKSSSNV